MSISREMCVKLQLFLRPAKDLCVCGKGGGKSGAFRKHMVSTVWKCWKFEGGSFLTKVQMNLKRMVKNRIDDSKFWNLLISIVFHATVSQITSIFRVAALT